MQLSISHNWRKYVERVPLHVMFLGTSGSGKTYLQERISELILIEDLDGALSVFYSLRELQTKRRFSKTVTLKDSKGSFHQHMPLDIIIDDLKGEDQRIVRLYMDDYAIICETIATLDDFKISKRILLDYDSNAEVYLNELEEFFKEVKSLKTIFATTEATQ